MPSRAKIYLREVGKAILDYSADVHDRFRRGEALWSTGEHGTAGHAIRARVARTVACSPRPMTRTAILDAIGEFPGRNHAERMYLLYRLLRIFPLFHEVAPHHWQVGRTNVGAILHGERLENEPAGVRPAL
jgi:hypothetical protein